MKRFFGLTVLALMGSSAFAGGLLTNANQSAAYVRMPARDASTDADAVYYNPAGLSFLDDGFHISLNNQSIRQRKLIKNDFSLLKNRENPVDEYVGKVDVPFFPSFYAIYKKNAFALGFGFQINGGGGSATFDDGLPSFESSIAMLPLKLNAAGIPAGKYDCDIEFEGKSIFWGTQLNASYAINDVISVSVGARLTIARNAYKGHISNISAELGGQMVNLSGYFGGLSEKASGAASSLKGISEKGAGSYTLDQLVGAGMMTAEQSAQISGGLGANYVEGMTIDQLAAAYEATATTTSSYAELTADKEVDAKQNGLGFAPIIGIDIKPNDQWNFGIKYEFRTKLDMEYETTTDNVGLFPDGQKLRSDVPAILSVGASYKPIEKLNLNLGMHYYFDKGARMESFGSKGVSKKHIDGNIIEIALGVEYGISDKLLASLGGFYTKKGVDDRYQSDMNQAFNSYSFGLGFGYKFTENLTFNIGAFKTFYDEDSKQITYANGETATESYNRKNNVLGLGIDFKF